MKRSAAQSWYVALDLTKRMLRHTPFIFLDLLDERELSALADELIDQSTAAFR